MKTENAGFRLLKLNVYEKMTCYKVERIWAMSPNVMLQFRDCTISAY